MGTISIIAVVDVAAALSGDQMEGNLYLVDNNRKNGSTLQGTDQLRTFVRKDDVIVWAIQALECESEARIVEIVGLPADVCEVEENTFPGTNVTHWTGVVKKDIEKALPYSLKFYLASREKPMSSPPTRKPCLIGV